MPDSADVPITPSLYEALDSAIQGKRLNPENVQERCSVLPPLEAVLSQLNACPIPEVGPEAKQIISLLWSKTHASEADAAVVLDGLESPTPVVRLVATEALQQIVGMRPEARLLYRAKRAVQDRKRSESSPLVVLGLTELEKQLAKSGFSQQKQVVSAPPPQNPYIAGLPIREAPKFYGRADIIEQIARTLGGDEGVRTVLMVGARRSGKTSLLYRLADGALGPGFLGVQIDMQALATADFAGMLRLISRSVASAVTGAKTPVEAKGDGLQGLSETIGRACAALGDRRLVVLFDEYELLERMFQGAPNAAPGLHSLLERYSRLCFVFAGSQKPETIRERSVLLLLDNSRTVNISFLSEQEARKLVQEPASGFLDYSGEALDAIYRLCNGHPFYTQLLCQMLFDRKTGGGAVSAADVEEVAGDFLLNPSAHLILTWKSLSPAQKLVASCLAPLTDRDSWAGANDIQDYLKSERYPRNVELGTVQGGLRDLQEMDLAKKRLGEPKFRLTMDLVRRWVAENRSLWDLRDEVSAGSEGAALARRIAATLTDFGLAASLLTLFFIVIRLNFVVAVSVVGGWFIIFPLVGERTIGMRFCGLRMLDADGRTLPLVRTLIVGVLLAMEFLLWLSICAKFVFKDQWPWWAWTLWAFGVLFEVFHYVRIHKNLRRQGLLEGAVNAIIVRRREQ